jgi:hypothetical protein
MLVCHYLKIVVQPGCQSRKDTADQFAKSLKFASPFCAVRHAGEVGMESMRDVAQTGRV